MKDQFKLSIEPKVEHPEMTINSFNNQFQLNEASHWKNKSIAVLKR